MGSVLSSTKTHEARGASVARLQRAMREGQWLIHAAPIKHSRLVLLTEVLLLTLALGGLGADLLVILLERGKILASLGELALLHALTDVPVDEGALGVHEVELVVDARESLGDGGGVRDHAHGAHDASEVAARHDSRRLVVDAALEAGRAPVDELNGALGLDGRNRR